MQLAPLDKCKCLGLILIYLIRSMEIYNCDTPFLLETKAQMIIDTDRLICRLIQISVIYVEKIFTMLVL